MRMSASIPFYFEPVKFHNPETGGEHLIVDGGVLSNFPVWLFDSDEKPRWPTFGLMLVAPDPRGPPTGPPGRAEYSANRIEATIDYVRSLVYTMLEAHDRRYIEMADFARTICIPTLGVRATDFDLPRKKRLELYESGRTAAEQFLETWSFEGYVEEFRREDRYSRRREAAERMHRAAEESER